FFIVFTMSSKVVVSSKSNLLSISLQNDRCSMTYSGVESALFVNPPDKCFVSTIDLSLKDSEGKELSSVSFSVGCTSGQQRIRTDGFFSLVFGPDETITHLPDSVLGIASSEFLVDRSKFEMVVDVKLVYAISDSFESRSSLVKIHSGTLKVGDTTIPISKEMLAVSSPFFDVLFFGPFAERKKCVSRIKEVDTDDFRWFLDSMLLKKYVFLSVHQSLEALVYADRFEMLYLHKHVFAYLRNYKLAEEEIMDALVLCSRFDNEEVIVWVLGQCESAHDRFDLISKCAECGETKCVTLALKVLKKSFGMMESNAYGLSQCLVRERNIIPIHIFGYDVNNRYEMEKHLALSLDSDGEFLWNELWTAIPLEYMSITINGRKKRSRNTDAGNGYYYKVRFPDAIEVAAHRF
ncbi:hypothetical protein PMAYCL1PPCAC_33438, partial [Pristionchus mayeri]